VKKTTQRTIIFKVLEDADDWVVSWQLIKTETPYGWLGTSADRCARLMVEEGLLERKNEGQYAYYRLKPKDKQEKLF
jgi:DNA-binding transcriptional regulator PaaX